MTDNRNLEVIAQHSVLMNMISISITPESTAWEFPVEVGQYAWGSCDPADPDYQPGTLCNWQWRMSSIFCPECGNYQYTRRGYSLFRRHIWCRCPSNCWTTTTTTPTTATATTTATTTTTTTKTILEQ